MAKSYNPLANRVQMSQILDALFPLTSYGSLTKFDLHKKFNDLLISNYSGESTLKYLLFKEFVKKRVTAAFEIRVNSSRVDFLTINGNTKSFEIKSSLDNLQKLGKQSSDYSKAFEYNFAVVDEKHLKNALITLPSNYGVWCYTKSKKTVYRQADLSKSLDPGFQLNLLTKKELLNGFKEFTGIKTEILMNLDPEEINSRFKNTLKARYDVRWSFLKSNVEKILPIDIQFFFSTNLEPELVYQIRF